MASGVVGISETNKQKGKNENENETERGEEDFSWLETIPFRDSMITSSDASHCMKTSRSDPLKFVDAVMMNSVGIPPELSFSANECVLDGATLVTSAKSGRWVGEPIRHFAGHPEGEGARMGFLGIHGSVDGMRRSSGLHCRKELFLGEG